MDEIELKPGYVYWLKDYTAPKVWMGNSFMCLLTDQIIFPEAEVTHGPIAHIKDWNYPTEIYKPERFKKFLDETVKGKRWKTGKE